MSDLRDSYDLERDPQEDRPRDPSFLDPVVKSNDPKSLKKKAIDDKSKSLKQENDLREILATQAGVRFIARVLGEICYIDATPFHTNTTMMANIAGRRQVAQTIKELIRDADFDLWVKVDRELESHRPKPESSKKGH